ncbi:hypothetical protein GO986_08695 [Deinococcus sp. HMF7620]|uniref:Uncharacterized protein n=1 Tax=Deinococcus arboris TaxID=2682977 RepID=A0A7C9LTT2_9DEIO|nr:hypothetical protein [Deinococcus arboris]MVN86840.1 hypothetical protein [Deinococcus arboris]
MTKTIQELASDARTVNLLNGWGLHFHISEIPNYLALVHSEITEAWEAEGRDALLVMAKIEANKARGYRHGGRRT